MSQWNEPYTVIDGRGAMSVFEIYIKTTPERLWEAITDPEHAREVQLRRRGRVRLDRRLRLSRRCTREAGVPISEGKNLEVDPPRRLVQSFKALWSDEVKADGESRVTWEIEPVGSSCRLRVTHDELAATPTTSSTAAGR